jgi:hypothetical protein
MANGIKYQAHEILNKVLNTAETGLQVDIVAGAEYAEDAAHTSADTGNFVLGVRNDTLAALGGTDGDYVPFQMNASGALFVEVSSSSGDDSIYVDDADWTDSTSKHTLVGGLYQSSPQSITDGDTGPLQVNANGNLIVDLSATDNAVLDAIDTVLDTIKTDTQEIEEAVETIEGAVSGSEMQVDVVAALPAGSNTIGVVDLGSTDNAVLDAMVVDLAAMETLLTAANVDHAANEALLTTIDSDTNDTKNALNNMLYGTALAVTAVHGGSDHSLGATYEAFHIGVGGDISLDCVTSGTNIVFKNLASGQMLPVRATVVNATNTTATNIVALKA